MKSPVLQKVLKGSAALVALGLAVCHPALAQNTLSMSSWVPPHHGVTKAMVEWGQEVEKATGGRVKFNLLSKHVSNPTGTFDSVRDGLADLSFSADGYTPGRFVLTKMAEMPFLGDSVEITTIAYNRIHERRLVQANEHKGVRVLAVFTHGPGQIDMAKKAINSLADLQGMKIRVGGGMVHEIAKAIGANVLLKPAPEAYELMSGGVVDGSFGPPEGIVSLNIGKATRFVTHIPGGLYNTSFAMLMNEERFAKLAKPDQDAITKLSGEHFARIIGKSWEQGDKGGWDAMKANGIQVIIANDAMVKEVRERTSGIEQAWIKEAGGKGVDPGRALAEFREEIRKVAAELGRK